MNTQMKSAEPRACRHCGKRARSLNGHILGCPVLAGLAQRLLDGHVPDDFAQRPPLEYVEPKLYEMLDQALTHGYVTGSVGCTWKEEDDHFTYEVSYTIKRKRAGGGRGISTATCEQQSMHGPHHIAGSGHRPLGGRCGKGGVHCSRCGGGQGGRGVEGAVMTRNDRKATLRRNSTER